MTDRELLELAALAAGIKAAPDPNGLLRDCTGAHPSMNIFAFSPWNPLADDGDALRLAVKLGLQVTPGTYNKEEATAYRSGQAEANEYVHFQQDIGAATRRAIVRAAAEIGKSMTGQSNHPAKVA